MEDTAEGSVAAVSERLRRWAKVRGTGFAKAVFGSEFARQDCLRRMAGDGIRVEDRMVLVQAGETDVSWRVDEWVRGAAEQGEGVASLVLSGGPGAAFEFRTACGRLSLYRERLGEMGAGLLVWLPAFWAEVFAREIPDFDSWMMLRLELTETGQAMEAAERRGEILLLPEEARGRAERAAARARQSEGENALQAAFEAVRTLESAGLVREAREIALEFWGLLKGERPQGWRALEARAAIYAAAGDLARGTTELEMAMARGMAERGEEDPEALRLASDLAEFYERQGRYAEAEPLLLRALVASEKVLGRTHADTLTSMNNLALLYTRQGRYAEAEPMFVWAVEALEESLGTLHPDTLTAVSDLAGLCVNQGRYAEAEQLLVRALSARESVLGRDHPSTLTSVNNLAIVYSCQGRYGDAEPLYVRALAARERVLGSEHPETQIVRENLAQLRARHSS